MNCFGWLADSWQKKRQLKLVQDQVSEVIQLMTTMMTAGCSLAESLRQAATQINPPFANILDQKMAKQRLGESLASIMCELRLEHPSEEMDLFATAVSISLETGASPLPLFGQTVKLAENHRRLNQKINLLTAQGKLQAIIMSLLPPMLCVVLCFIDSSYLTPLLTTPMGLGLLLIVSALNLLGLLWILRICRIPI